MTRLSTSRMQEQPKRGGRLKWFLIVSLASFLQGMLLGQSRAASWCMIEEKNHDGPTKWNDIPAKLDKSFNDLQAQVATKTAQPEVTAPVAKSYASSYAQLAEFLQNNPNTAGARFIALLREHLHPHTGAENERLDACSQREFPKLYDRSRCFAGRFNQTTMPLKSQEIVREVSYYSGMAARKKEIPVLGTTWSCLPLFLAGASVASTSMALELGPYFGFSSKCIVMGMKTQGVRPNSYIAFDTFTGESNFKSILRSKEHKWLVEENPSYQSPESSFLFLWEQAVKPVYPTARGQAALITKKSLNVNTLDISDSGSIEFISIDSAKSWGMLQIQLDGLGQLRAGTILFLLDFEFVETQIQAMWLFAASLYGMDTT